MADISEQKLDSKNPFLEWVFYRSVGIEREDKWMEWYDFWNW